MFVLLLVAGALLGVLLGVMALSMFSSVSVAGLTTPHPQRPARERREHEHPDFSKREKRYPDVPPPLAGEVRIRHEAVGRSGGGRW